MKDPSEQLLNDPFDDVMYQGQLDVNEGIARLLAAHERADAQLRDEPAQKYSEGTPLAGIIFFCLIMAAVIVVPVIIGFIGG